MSRIREKNKQLILEAASEVFASQGFAATKTTDIAEKSNLPKANIYYYFKSKENLYRSVLESVVKPLLAASEPFYSYDEPRKALEAYIREKIHISQKYPNASKVFASEMMFGAPHLPKELTRQLSEEAKHSAERIQNWVDSGKMAPVDPYHLLFTIWASTQIYADFDWQISLITGKNQLEQTDYDHAASFICQLVLTGCGLIENHKMVEKLKSSEG